MDYLITLTQRYPDSDRLVEALLSGDRILHKIDILVYNRSPKNIENEPDPTKELIVSLVAFGLAIGIIGTFFIKSNH
jgi:hypothetical protein